MTSGPKVREGLVLSSSRHYLTLIEPGGQSFEARVTSKDSAIIVGDRVRFVEQNGEYFVSELLPRANIFSRSYREAERGIAANVDRLFIVSAVLPLFNTVFIDRVMTVAFAQDIPFSLVLNKVDLGIEQTEPLLAVYERLGITVDRISAKFEPTMPELVRELRDQSLVVLCGVSGVGKSTILNRLVPDAVRRISDVSSKTGQGKQTTSQSCGYPYITPAGQQTVLVDLPGLQKFGVGHISKEQVAESFPEIVQHRTGCKFSDCAHIGEDDCQVKEAVRAANMARFRYLSYVDMISEIESEKEY